jgi:hypothetical protein
MIDYARSNQSSDRADEPKKPNDFSQGDENCSFAYSSRRSACLTGTCAKL